MKACVENATSHIDISGEPQVILDFTLLNFVLHPIVFLCPVS